MELSLRVMERLELLVPLLINAQYSGVCRILCKLCEIIVSRIDIDVDVVC